MIKSPITHTLTITLADAAGLAWAQRTVTVHHYLRAPVDPRARPMAYIIRRETTAMQWEASEPKPYPKSVWLPPGHPTTYKAARLEATQTSERVGLVMLGIPHATKCSGWWGYPGLPTQWQVVDLCRIYLDPAVQYGGQWCEPGEVPGYVDRKGRWRPTVATWAIGEVLARVQADRVRLWPPVYPAQPYHIELAISYSDPKYHKGTIYRQANALPMYTDGSGAPIPGPSGKYGWAWWLPAPQWTWQDLECIKPRTMRLF